MRVEKAVWILVGAVLFVAPGTSAEVTVQKVPYGGWKNCYKITNGRIEAIVTSDVGPRVIRFGFVGGVNEFKEFAEQMGTTGGDEWKSYGGHRLWHSPEQKPRSYAPDNGPIEVRRAANGVRCIQPVEVSTGIQKEIILSMDPTKAHVKVTHRLRNKGLWPVRLAPWALTVMATGGRAILPLPSTAPDGRLLPNGLLVIWPYTDLSDPRLLLGKKYIVFVQDSKAKVPNKVGVMATDGWGAYVNHGNLFLKTFRYDRKAEYPDYGCSLESYDAPDFLELETVAPLTTLDPGATVEHVEDWYLVGGIKTTPHPDNVEATILPLIKPLLP